MKACEEKMHGTRPFGVTVRDLSSSKQAACSLCGYLHKLVADFYCYACRL